MAGDFVRVTSDYIKAKIALEEVAMWDYGLTLMEWGEIDNAIDRMILGRIMPETWEHGED